MVGDPGDVKDPLDLSRTAPQKELTVALARDTHPQVDDLDPAGVDELQSAEIKYDRLRVALQGSHQGCVKLIPRGEIQFSVRLYDVPVGTAAEANLELDVVSNPELFGEAHIDTSALELSDRCRPGGEDSSPSSADQDRFAGSS
jgi:hypothetical protein